MRSCSGFTLKRLRDRTAELSEPGPQLLKTSSYSPPLFSCVCVHVLYLGLCLSFHLLPSDPWCQERCTYPSEVQSEGSTLVSLKHWKGPPVVLLRKGQGLSGGGIVKGSKFLTKEKKITELKAF